jgi:hypothetical protein
MKRFLGFEKVVEKSRFGPLGWCRWLAVSRSFFFMEVSKSRYCYETPKKRP